MCGSAPSTRNADYPQPCGRGLLPRHRWNSGFGNGSLSFYLPDRYLGARPYLRCLPAVPLRGVGVAKDFYTRQVGFNLDNDVRPTETMRVVQMTPPGSACSCGDRRRPAARLGFVVTGPGRGKETATRKGRPGMTRGPASW